MKNIIIIIITLLILLGCSLERSNPLDIDFDPGQVTNITFRTSQNTSENEPKWIDISWSPVAGVDGYLIFRSQSYNGSYILENRILEVDENNANQYQTYRDTKHLVSNDYYFYKIASFKYVGEERLEGPKSAYYSIRLP